jgi:chorismate synthase
MSTFGKYFRVTTYGESHGLSVGVIIDGVPPGMPLTEDDIQPQMTRRRPGQSALSTPRNEKDRVTIQSGTENGQTLGSPIAIRVPNEDQRPRDYGGGGKNIDMFPRPSHADWTYMEKYGTKSSSGGGRSSARETIGRVAAGAIAAKYLKEAWGVEIVAFTNSVGHIDLFPKTKEHPSPSTNPAFLELIDKVKQEDVDANLVRCPDEGVAKEIAELIGEFRDREDSIGGTVMCVIRNCPSGLGEPCFDKLEAELGKAMLSLPATKGVEIGSGFGGTRMPGSVHNDPFIKAPAVPPGEVASRNIQRPRLTTKTNNSAGIQGGISNGAHIYFNTAFKPPATIGQAQQTTGYDEEEGVLAAKGRHDPCVIPRAVPIVEAMAAIVIMDSLLAQLARKSAQSAMPGWSNKSAANGHP